MTYDEAIAQLTREGNYRVPCSRYGNNTAECADTAYRAMQAYLDASSADDEGELLEYLMGLVVNDHDDIAYLLIEHNGELFPPASDTPNVDAAKAQARPITDATLRDMKERGQIGTPPPLVTSLDVEDVAWLRTGRDVNMDNLETWRLSSMDSDTARVLRERWGAY